MLNNGVLTKFGLGVIDRHSISLHLVPIHRSHTSSFFNFNCTYGQILYCIRDKARHTGFKHSTVFSYTFPTQLPGRNG